jgi:hypothetical protein
MTIVTRAQELLPRLENHRLADERLDEKQRLQARNSEVRELAEKVGRVTAKESILRGETIPLSLAVGKITSVVTRIQKVATRFGETPQADELTKGKHWERMLGEVGTAMDDADDQLTAAWRDYVEMLYNGPDPDDLRSLAQTDGNRQTLRRYTEEHMRLRDCEALKFIELDDIRRARDAAESLKTLHSQFDHDVPEPVQRFLQGVAQGGASLELLTPEVIQWLSAAETLSHYNVQRKGRVGGSVL